MSTGYKEMCRMHKYRGTGHIYIGTILSCTEWCTAAMLGCRVHSCGATCTATRGARTTICVSYMCRAHPTALCEGTACLYPRALHAAQARNRHAPPQPVKAVPPPATPTQAHCGTTHGWVTWGCSLVLRPQDGIILDNSPLDTVS